MIQPMSFALILATIGKTDELRRFLTSVEAPREHPVEVFVVDQNDDDRLTPVLDLFDDRLRLIRLHSEPGLSRARNAALPLVHGDFVGFPDDDCLYPPSLLDTVARWFSTHPGFAGLTGRAVDPAGRSYARFDKEAGPLTPRNAWQRAASFTMFFRREAIQRIGGFDETLGLGSGTPWEGGEDIDYPLRAIGAGLEVFYLPEIVVVHPNPFAKGYADSSERALKYGLGIGRVWRKHRFPLWQVVYHLARPLGGAVTGLAQGRPQKAKYHLSAFRGRLLGWLSRT